MANTNPRYYVLVDMARSQSGIPIPSKLYWYDGRSWKIDKVELMQPVPNAMDGSVRYAVIIGETKTYIYKDKMGWYVYPKEKIIAKDIERGKRKVIQSFI